MSTVQSVGNWKNSVGNCFQDEIEMKENVALYFYCSENSRLCEFKILIFFFFYRKFQYRLISNEYNFEPIMNLTHDQIESG